MSVFIVTVEPVVVVTGVVTVVVAVVVEAVVEAVVVVGSVVVVVASVVGVVVASVVVTVVGVVSSMVVEGGVVHSVPLLYWSQQVADWAIPSYPALLCQKQWFVSLLKSNPMQVGTLLQMFSHDMTVCIPASSSPPSDKVFSTLSNISSQPNDTVLTPSVDNTVVVEQVPRLYWSMSALVSSSSSSVWV